MLFTVSQRKGKQDFKTNATLTSLRKGPTDGHEKLIFEKRFVTSVKKLLRCVCSRAKSTMNYDVVIVLDPDIYAKALDIPWKIHRSLSE